MKNRILSLFLALVMLLGILPVASFAADTPEDALGEIDIYNGDHEIAYLSINGAVRTQKYTYYNYTTPEGWVRETPAYCVNPNLYGVPQTVGPGESIKYIANEKASDPKVIGIICNGYPHYSLEALNLDDKYQAYYATKMALWCYLMPGWNINNLKVAPGLSSTDQEIANRVLDAAKKIYQRGTTYNYMLEPKLTATPDRSVAYPVTVDGRQYKQQIFTIQSETFVYDYEVKVAFSDPAGVPSGTRIVNMDNQDITAVTTDGNKGQFKVLYPVDSIQGETGSVQLTLNAAVAKYAVMYAICAQKDQYGNLQNYICDIDNNAKLEVAAVSNYFDSEDEDPPEETSLRIIKLEEGTEIPLEGAVFSVYDPEGKKLGSYSTNANGSVTIPVTLAGHYTVTEDIPPEYHLLPNVQTQHVNVEYGKIATVTFTNAPYGSLKVQKLSDTGDALNGVTVQIKHIESGEVITGTTQIGGAVVFDKLKPGAYEVKETAGISGWIAETDTIQTVTVIAGKTSDVTIINKALPGLRIIKYDRNSHEVMEGVTFAVYKDGAFLGNYKTDPMGEILIPDAEPGTYRVFEVDTGDDGHILDTTPQEIELKAGDGILELVFFNDKLPGLHLIKVDSADLSKPIANAKFRIEAVDHSFGPEEFTTGTDGTIDLSKLPTGAYVVTELECPGYVIDEAQRIIQLDANETAQFVFTNSKLPSLQLIKVSSDGTPLAGVSFRLAKIEDASHYLDRTTDRNGEILWEGLEPGVYSLIETATVSDHILDLREHHVELFPGKTSTIVLENDRRPNLTIIKRDADTGEVVPGTVFEVRFADGHSVQDVTTGPDGRGYLENLLPGVYEISEKSVPEPYLQDAASQLVTLYPNRDREVLFENHKRPSIEIIKENSITHERQAHVPFQVWYASNNTSTGEYNDLGVYYTDENGRIVLTEPDIYLRDGWFRVKELEPPHGFALADPDTQEAFIPSGTSHTFVFQNRPLSAICVWKYDSVSPNMAIEGAVFQIRYLSGNTSGTGGTVIGTFRTGKNGSFTATGLPAGTYIIEELSSDGDHVIDTPPQTVYLSGEDQEVIQVYFGNSPKGSLLVKKIDSVTRQPLSDVEFLVTDSKGNVVGNANGKFVTDSTGSFTVSGIDPGTTLIVKEVRSKSGYILDDVPQTAVINAGQTVTLEFRNQPMGSLLIRKVCSVNPSVTLSNAEFKVAYSDGTLIGDSNGVYQSDENGEVRIDGLIPGKSVVVTETQAPPGFLIDSQSQTIVIQAGKTVTITMKNQPKGQLIIQKRDSQTNEVLPGAEFRITTAAGCEVGLDGVIGTSTLTSNGIFTTDSQGEIRISNLAPGAYVISEIKAPDGGYVIDTPSTNVVIGTNGDTQTVVIKNTRKGNLIIEKYDSVTKQPLAGARFKVTNANGELTPDNEGLTSSNGLYVTDQNGQIVLSKLLPDTYIVSEERSPDNYQADPNPQTVVVNAGDTQTVRFYNDPLCTLTLLKRDAVTKKPLAGAEFLVRDSEGKAIGPNNGLYITGTDGTVTVSGMAPNSTIVCSEVKAPSGYVLDETPKTIIVRSGVANSLIFDNEPATTLIIQKFIEGTENEPLSGVCFKVTDGSGAAVGPDDGVYYTDHAGEIVLSGLEPGITVKAREIKTVEGFVLDGTPQDILIKAGEVQRLTYWNKRAGTLVIQKKDSVSGALIAGAQFQLTYANGGYVDNDNGHLSSNGLYTTDAQGEIRISGITGTVVCKEVKSAPGYVIDQSTQTQTVTVNPEDTQTLVFLNEPLCSLTITKLDSVTGKPVPGTVFEVKDGNGNVIGRYTTGSDGTVTVTGLIPGTTVVVSEVKVPDGYVLDPTPQTIIIQNGTGNSVTTGVGGGNSTGTGSGNGLTFENDPTMTLTIHKYIEGTANEPLAGVAFKIVDGSGAAVGSGDGVFYTNAEGEIVVEGLEPGITVTAREVKTVEGFVLDGTPKTVKITANSQAPELIFWNKRAGTLVIQKKDSVSGALIAGAQFQLTYANGGYVDNDNGHLSSNGLYTTDAQGEIRISGIIGTVVCKEVQSAPGYVIDPSTQTQTVTVNPMDTQTLTFLNEPLCSLTITKLDSVTGKPVPGTVFTVKDGNGNLLGTYTTGQDGTVTVTGLVPGTTVVVSEVKVPAGYVLDPTPQTIIVQNGTGNSVVTGVGGGNSTGTGSGNGLTFEDDPTMTLTIHKYIEGTANEPLAGVAFKIVDGSGAAVGNGDGVYYTDAAGKIVIEDLEPGTTVTAQEIKTVDGFVLDGTPKTVKIKAGSQAPELVFWNQRAGELVIRKLDSVTKQPLAGVEFELTYAGGGYVDDANGHLSSNGRYTTNDAGEIRISGVVGTIVAKEVKSLPNYTINESTRIQTVVVRPEDTQTLVFYNDPVITQTLTIQKFVDGTTDPIQGVTFLVTDSSGQLLGPNNGEYITDQNGRIVITDLTPGVTITAKEVRTVSGFVLDTTPQSILIKEGPAQTLTFFNKAEGGLELIKVSESDKSRRIPGVTFEIRKIDGGLVTTVTTDSTGRVHADLNAGDYYCVEIEAAQGFKLDATPTYFTVQDGKTTTVTITNKPFSGILIHKTDSVTGKGIYGVTFLLYDSTNTPIGQYTSDNSGYVYIENLTASGRYYLRELENAGYIPDTQMKTVYVTAGETTLIEWKNTPITAQIQITKKSADYNPTNGLPAGTLLEGAIFEIYDKANNLVDTIQSDSRGLAVSRPLPLGRYTVREVKAPDNYGISGTDLTAYLEHEGEIVRFEVTNKALATGVSITKTGPAEAMAGQPVRYVFSEIANSSNVRLDNFYWRDTLPAEVRLDTIVTGTYNFPGVYKITYRVNGGEYRTLADNLSTQKNYTLAASATALGLASNERVTEIMFVFGQAPAGFAQVEKPYLYCTAVANIASTSFVNVADVGGTYNGVWVQAVSRWVTKVYGKPVIPTLPRTGY